MHEKHRIQYPGRVRPVRHRQFVAPEYVLLDLLYLLTYNRTLKGGGDLLAALQDFVVTGPTNFEKHMLRRYERAVPDGAYPPGVLNAMFFVHHVAVRYKYTLDSDRVAEAVRDVLSLLTKPMAARGLPEFQGVGSC